jgi:Flp pilus assembly protein TadD, contains TPR repeats
MTRIFVFFLTFTILTFAGCSLRPNETGGIASAKENVSSDDPEIKSALAQIDKTPDSTDGFNRLASIYIRKARETGDFGLNSKAQTAIDKALEISPQDISSRKLQASLLLTFHRFAEGLEAGKALQNEMPKDAFVYGVLTDANAELGNYDLAVEAAQKMVDLRPNASSYARVGHIRSLFGDHKGAVEMLATAARITDPKASEAIAWCLVQLGDEYWKHGQFAESEKAYDQALETFPNYYFALAGKGRARAAVNDLEGAEKFLVDSQNRVPNVETIIFLGDLYSAQGNTEKAKQQYDLVEVVEQKLGLNNDQKRLALLWADHDTRLDEALTIAEREYAARKDIFTADTAAWVRYKKGDFQGAKAAIDDAMKLKTNDARMLYHAAMIEKALGDQVKAKGLFETALKLDPSFDLVQAPIARRELSEIK